MEKIIDFCFFKLPVFRHGNSKVLICFIKSVNYNENQDVFERFSRHIFEHVFDYSDCTFNIQQSPFKLLPCLLNSKSLTIQIHLTCNFRFR